MASEKKITIPKWLEDLQQRSWEPEILLSGIVLYGMFKVPELLEQFLSFYKLNIHGNSSDIDNLVALFKMGIYWLITGLIMHLICRGIWIGMVGLSYAFPNGIRMERLDYKGRFLEKVKNTPGYEEIVIRLEKISSALFSVSFMLFMSLIGGYFFFLTLVVMPFTIAWLGFDMSFSGKSFSVFQSWVFVVLIVGVIGLIDFVTLGYLRKFKWFAKAYWPLHRFISFLTLSRFYRPIYYGMVTNFNKWAFFSLLTIFAFVSIVGAGTITDTRYSGDGFSRLSNWSEAQGYSAFVGYYDDQNADNPSMKAHIPSDIINVDVLRLFVVANIGYEENMEKNAPIDSLRKVYPDTSSTALLSIMVSEFFTVSLDDRPITNVRWFFSYKSHLNQRGFLTYIDISELEEGLHNVKINGPEDIYSFPFATIPFYRNRIQQTQQPTTPNDKKEEESMEEFQPKPFGIRE